MTMGVAGGAKVPIFPFFPPFGGKSEKRAWKFPQVTRAPLHACMFVYGVSCFFLTSQSFCHPLILKLESKGMEGWIANLRGFWKFPFYGTWVFKNSSLSVVFLWFGWQCPALPLPGPSLLKQDPSHLQGMGWRQWEGEQPELDGLGENNSIEIFFYFFQVDNTSVNLYSQDFQ